MHNLRFRAWDKKNNMMLYHFLISSDGEVFAIREPNYPNRDQIGMNGLIPDMGDVEIMQSTGITDKNGKEIYCGDLLESGSKIVWEVHSENLALLILRRPDEEDTEMEHVIQPSWDEIERLEIIGNTYENPELLPQTK